MIICHSIGNSEKGFVMKYQRIILISLTGMLLIPLFFTGCVKPIIQSRWREHEIQIDGRDEDWGNFIQFYHEERKFVLCVFNDENDLYLKISSPDRMLQQQFLLRGFTVWFDPGGGKEKVLGIHFPKEMEAGTFRALRPGRRNEPNIGSFAREKSLKKELDILGPGGKEHWTFSTDDAKGMGIQVDFGESAGNLIYELRMPLKKNERSFYAVGSDMAGTIGIGFETGIPDKESLRKNDAESNAHPNSGLPGGNRERNGLRGGREGFGGGQRSMMQRPLDIWIKVTPAAKP